MSHAVLGRRHWHRGGLFFTIRQDGMLNGSNNLIDRLPVTIRDLIERRMADLIRAVHIE